MKRTWGIRAGLFVSAALLVGGASTARAQTDPTMYNLPIDQTIQTMDMSSRLFQIRPLEEGRTSSSSAKRGRGKSAPRGGGGGPSTSTPARTRPAGPPGTTTFRPVAPSVAPGRLALEVGRTPDERARLERMFTDLLENYRDRLRRGAGPQNDVARAASYLVAASHMVYFDTEFMGDEKYAALREQMHEVFATDPRFRRLSDREKQQLFEGYGITATWLDAGFRIVKQKGDRQAVEQWRSMAKVNLQNMLGAPPERVSFTAAGVEYK